MAITPWLHYADQTLVPLCRSPPGSNVPISDKSAADYRSIVHMQRAHTRNICFPDYFSGGLCGSNLIVSGPAQGYVCATRVNGGLHACSNRLRLPRIRLEYLLLRWIHSVLVGAGAEQCLLRAWRARGGSNSPGIENMNPVCTGRLQELRNEISNLVNAIAQGALRSSLALADRLARAESILAGEAEKAAVGESAGEMRILRSLEFCKQFMITISARFQENRARRARYSVISSAERSD
jgi:hypothetical protein